MGTSSSDDHPYRALVRLELKEEYGDPQRVEMEVRQESFDGESGSIGALIGRALLSLRDGEPHEIMVDCCHAILQNEDIIRLRMAADASRRPGTADSPPGESKARDERTRLKFADVPSDAFDLSDDGWNEWRRRVFEEECRLRLAMLDAADAARRYSWNASQLFHARETREEKQKADKKKTNARTKPKKTEFE